LIQAGVLTLSDKGSRGEREDLSGPEAARMLRAIGIETVHSEIVPDEADLIAAKLVEFADVRKLDLVVTTGGTGVSPRDVTPDATLAIIDREIPGMAEAMRRESMLKTPHAMISRAVAGVRGTTLIVNLPGSPRGVRENLAVILPALQHAIEKIKGDPADCASQET